MLAADCGGGAAIINANNPLLHFSSHEVDYSNLAPGHKNACKKFSRKDCYGGVAAGTAAAAASRSVVSGGRRTKTTRSGTVACSSLGKRCLNHILLPVVQQAEQFMYCLHIIICRYKLES